MLNWTAPAYNGGRALTGYNVYRGTYSGGETLIANLGVVLFYNSSGLTNGQIYYYQVTAVNTIGESAKSTEMSVTPATVPTAPQTVIATGGYTCIVLN